MARSCHRRRLAEGKKMAATGALGFRYSSMDTPKKTLAHRSGAVGSCKGENKEEGAVTGEASRGGVQGQGRGNTRARRRQGLG